MATKTTVNNGIGYKLPLGVSLLGTPIIDNVTFPSGSYEDLNGVEQAYPKLIINNANLTVGRAKRIVSSTVNGRSGTIKEYINSQDYNIKLTGKIDKSTLLDGDGFIEVSNIDVMPFQELQAFTEIEKVPESITVLSKFLNSVFDIDNVVITSFDINNAGDVNTFDVNINMLSDEQIDLTTF